VGDEDLQSQQKEKNMKRFIYTLISFWILLNLTACVGPFVNEYSVPEEVKQRLDYQMVLLTLKDLDNIDFYVVKEVVGISCFNNLIVDSAASENEALLQLKLSAQKVGADALLNASCKKEGTSLAKNCWSSITCSADAIKIRKTSQRKRQKGQVY